MLYKFVKVEFENIFPKDEITSLEDDVKNFEKWVALNNYQKFTYGLRNQSRTLYSSYGNALIYILSKKYIVVYDRFSITFLDVLK